MKRSQPVQCLGVLLEMATESLGDTDGHAQGVRPLGLWSSFSSLYQGYGNCVGKDSHSGGHLVMGHRRGSVCAPSSFLGRGKSVGVGEGMGRWLQCSLSRVSPKQAHR